MDIKEYGSKLCPSCKIIVPLTEFYKDKTKAFGVGTYCKPCSIIRFTKSYDKHRKEVIERAVIYKRKKLFNIDKSSYDLMLENQNYKCAICTTDTPGGRGAFHVDHCHTTGKIRGLLCNSCNLGLGIFKDSVERLSAAKNYLEQNG